jgi:hypothetical protein
LSADRSDTCGQSRSDEGAVQACRHRRVGKDLSGIVASWNKAADEIIGQPITRIIPPERIDEEPSILARIRSDLRADQAVNQGVHGQEASAQEVCLPSSTAQRTVHYLTRVHTDALTKRMIE